ncbi:MAG: HAMP domain-containing histidine kinase [Flavobacteriia bacterium]|nr:HAMP domain-containing histidine kinase [Flavobacteriia bacterium]
MSLYHRLNKIKALQKSYSLKFLSVAFLGIHLPVIGLVITLQMARLEDKPWTIVAIVTGVTLVSSIITLYILRELTQPIREVAHDVAEYQNHRRLPTWKISGADEIAQLRRHVESALFSLEDQRIKQEDLAMLLTHDLRSPIGTAINALDLLESSNAEERKEQIDNLKQFLTNQLSFIDVMLQIQKYENLSSGESLDRISVSSVIAKATAQVKSKLDKKDLKLNVDLESDTLILGSETMMTQAVVNILSNSIKFSPTGGSIAICGQTINDDHFVLSISDSGIGMSEKKLKEIFNRTLKEQMKGTSGEESTGLGLYLTKTLIAKQSGTLTAESDGLNKGSTFTLTMRKEFAA